MSGRRAMIGFRSLIDRMAIRDLTWPLGCMFRRTRLDSDVSSDLDVWYQTRQDTSRKPVQLVFRLLCWTIDKSWRARHPRSRRGLDLCMVRAVGDRSSRFLRRRRSDLDLNRRFEQSTDPPGQHGNHPTSHPRQSPFLRRAQNSHRRDRFKHLRCSGKHTSTFTSMTCFYPNVSTSSRQDTS